MNSNSYNMDFAKEAALAAVSAVFSQLPSSL